MKPAPLQPRRLSDSIVERIETLVLEGSLRPGERLPAERALAEEFGVSRPSVREAIQKLVARGLLVSRHGGGTWGVARPRHLDPAGRCWWSRTAD